MGGLHSALTLPYVLGWTLLQNVWLSSELFSSHERPSTIFPLICVVFLSSHSQSVALDQQQHLGQGPLLPKPPKGFRFLCLIDHHVSGLSKCSILPVDGKALCSFTGQLGLGHSLIHSRTFKSREPNLGLKYALFAPHLTIFPCHARHSALLK